MTGQVVLAIYYEALRLWMKKCPYYPHPGNRARNAAVDAGPTGRTARDGQPAASSGEPRLWDRFLRRAVFRRLEQIRDGRIEIVDGGTRHSFGPGGPSALEAEVQVHDPRFYRHLALGGNLGGAEAFIRGYWDCDDLVSLVRIFCRNRSRVAERQSRMGATGGTVSAERPTCCGATPSAAVAGISPPTTIWATSSSPSFSTRR